MAATFRRARAVAIIVTSAILSTVIGISPTAAAGDLPSTITLSVDPNPGYAFNQITFTSYVDFPMGTSDAPTGSISYFETTSGAHTLIATTPYPGTPQPVQYLDTSGFDIGTHTLVAELTLDSPIYAPSTSSPVDYVVDVADSSTYLSGPAEVETHHQVQFEVSIGTATNAFTQDATITFSRTGLETPMCDIAMGDSNSTLCTVSSLPIGTWEVTAQYSGNTWVAGSTSDPLTITVTPDTVHATNVGVQYPTFYPVADGYLDTVAIKGVRNEGISVTARIYTPGGSLIKTLTKSAGTGAYALSWNGRRSDGSIYPEGKYKVVQTLKDLAGTTQAFTSYVTLSKKKLYVYTKTISKDGSAATAAGTLAGGTVSVNSSTDALKLYAPDPYYSWAGAGWQLTLPSATVYKSFYVRIVGRHSGASGLTRLGAQNFTWCALSSDWSEGCFGAWKAIPTTSGTTLYIYRTANLSSAYRSGRTVRLSVSSYGGTTWIYKAQVVVTYGVLKY